MAAGAFGAAGVFSIAAAKAVPGRSATRLPSGQAPAATNGGTSGQGNGTDTNANGGTANNGTTANTDPNAVDPNAGLTPLAPPPLALGSSGGGGSVVSGGS